MTPPSAETPEAISAANNFAEASHCRGHFSGLCSALSDHNFNLEPQPLSSPKAYFSSGYQTCYLGSTRTRAVEEPLLGTLVNRATP